MQQEPGHMATLIPRGSDDKHFHVITYLDQNYAAALATTIRKGFCGVLPEFKPKRDPLLKQPFPGKNYKNNHFFQKIQA
jgi:hypothetical protein